MKRAAGEWSETAEEPAAALKSSSHTRASHLAAPWSKKGWWVGAGQEGGVTCTSAQVELVDRHKHVTMTYFFHPRLEKNEEKAVLR